MHGMRFSIRSKILNPNNTCCSTARRATRSDRFNLINTGVSHNQSCKTISITSNQTLTNTDTEKYKKQKKEDRGMDGYV